MFGVPTIRYDIQKPARVSVADPNVFFFENLELCWLDYSSRIAFSKEFCILWSWWQGFQDAKTKEINKGNFLKYRVWF